MQSNVMMTGLILATIVVPCQISGCQPPTRTQHRRTSVPISNSSPSKATHNNSIESRSPKVVGSASEQAGKNLPDCTRSDCNCSDFKIQAEAQAVLKAFPDDPYKLDRNRDGMACEGLSSQGKRKN